MKRKKRGLCVILACMMLTMWCPATVHAQEEKTDEDVTLSPYFFVEGGDPSVDHLPLKGTEVETNINGTIAEIRVIQTYANEGERPINASYVFPASTRVAIHGMTMTVGDQMVRAQIKEKEEAQEIFEEAKSEGKNTSLLEEQRANVFTMDVANIMPGDEVRIELNYTELIESEEGVYQFVFPTVVGPRYSGLVTEEEAKEDSWIETPYLEEGVSPDSSYDITVNLSTGVPLKDLTCPSHEVKIQQDQEAMAKVTLANPEEFAGNRDYILEYKLTGETMNSGLMLYEGETENFFQLTVQPPERYEPEEILPREYIFVLDVSGSMDGYALDTAQKLIRDLVLNLRETDHFNLILFSDTVWTMMPSSIEATKPNVDKAIQLIEELKGGGGTELASALLSAVHIPKQEDTARSVVIITDGYVSNEKEIFSKVSDYLGEANFFAFGIGSSVNRYLIEGIADVGMGEKFIVIEETEAAEAAERFRTYIQAPLLTDIQVTFDGLDVYDTDMEKIPTLFAARPITLYGKWKGNPSGTIHITGKRGGEDYTEDIPVSQENVSEKNEAISYLWARNRVQMLTDYSMEEEEEVKAEVIALGLNYSMVTPYTSFVAVIDTVKNPEGDSTDVEQPQSLPLGVSSLAVGYTMGSEPGDFLLIWMAGAILLFRYYAYKRRKQGEQ
ncbi:MAG: VWA domain-containing protein [Lachnospiraceae bacterium]|nr:VWA domain-containing protein [Lachnospiraceae bacterium]